MGVKPPTKFSKRGGLDRTSTLRGVTGKKGVTCFRGGTVLEKNKLKFETFNDKKSL